MTGNRNSYDQILRASSIMGGSQAITYLVGLLRVKLVAMLIGPAGVGLVGVLTSATTLLSTVSSLGIGSSGVRRLAQHQGDAERIGRDAAVLQKVALATGLMGWLLAVVFARQISVFMTGGEGLAASIAILGSVVFLSCTAMANLAVLQGLRRVGDLARASVIGVILASAVSVALFAWLGERGVVPVLLVSAAIAALAAWFYVHRLKLLKVELTARELAVEGVGLAKLGLAFVWSGLLVAAIDMLARALITRQFGMDEAGVYQAAWALSGMFAGFVLGAMGTDFYPRLAAVIGDQKAARHAVNEQTEIGLLLALPGILGAVCLSPWIMPMLYTREFLPASDVLPWFVLGVLGRVISWPLGYIQLAAGAARWFAATETAFVALQTLLLLTLVPVLGAKGAAIAFAVTYALYVPGMLWVAHRLIAHRWSAGVAMLILVAAGLVCVALVVRYVLDGALQVMAGSALTAGSALFALRAIARRLPATHGLIAKLRSVPGGRWFL